MGEHPSGGIQHAPRRKGTDSDMAETNDPQVGSPAPDYAALERRVADLESQLRTAADSDELLRTRVSADAATRAVESLRRTLAVAYEGLGVALDALPKGSLVGRDQQLLGLEAHSRGGSDRLLHGDDLGNVPRIPQEGA